MSKQLNLILLVLVSITLCFAAAFYWPSPRAHDEIQKSRIFVSEPNLRGEPITPIPLKLNLDRRKVALGKRLFYDPRLSHDDTISCAHCHNLSKGGEDGLRRPIGINGKIGNINTLTVFNSGFNFRLFWDGRAATLEEQMDFPLRNSDEMGSSLPEIVSKLKLDDSYRRDFAAIYNSEVQPEFFKDAIATFERSLTTPNSKFDRYLRGDDHALNIDELSGYQLFKNLGCISCHQGMNVGGNMYEKMGIVFKYYQARGNVQEVDYGRYNLTKNENDRYEFRVPSLRNVALTAPYFHDASANTLEQAVGTMAKYQLGISLPKNDIEKIVKFLNTLTGVYQEGSDK
jgi:cytochrome c peroxidase